MRLRRETGDFQIKVTTVDNTTTVNSIRPGLSAEDLIGEVVDVDGTLFVVVTASEENGVVSMVINSEGTLHYTKATGAITVST